MVRIHAFLAKNSVAMVRILKRYLLTFLSNFNCTLINIGLFVCIAFLVIYLVMLLISGWMEFNCRISVKCHPFFDNFLSGASIFGIRLLWTVKSKPL